MTSSRFPAKLGGILGWNRTESLNTIGECRRVLNLSSEKYICIESVQKLEYKLKNLQRQTCRFLDWCINSCRKELLAALVANFSKSVMQLQTQICGHFQSADASSEFHLIFGRKWKKFHSLARISSPEFWSSLWFRDNRGKKKGENFTAARDWTWLGAPM